MDALFEEVQVRRTSGHETELGGDRGGVGRQGRRSEDNKARGASSVHNPDIQNM